VAADYSIFAPPVPEDIPDTTRRTCFCGKLTVVEPNSLPDAQRQRCPICERDRQTVISGHLLDVTQFGEDQSIADGLVNGRVVLVVDA
jgi:hypothetical protein